VRRQAHDPEQLAHEARRALGAAAWHALAHLARRSRVLSALSIVCGLGALPIVAVVINAVPIEQPEEIVLTTRLGWWLVGLALCVGAALAFRLAAYLDEAEFRVAVEPFEEAGAPLGALRRAARHDRRASAVAAEVGHQGPEEQRRQADMARAHQEARLKRWLRWRRALRWAVLWSTVGVYILATEGHRYAPLHLASFLRPEVVAVECAAAMLLLLAGLVHLAIGRRLVAAARTGEGSASLEGRLLNEMAAQEARDRERRYREALRVPWWLAEFTGAHLVWWGVCFYAIGGALGAWDLLSEDWDYVIALLFGMFAFKVLGVVGALDGWMPSGVYFSLAPEEKARRRRDALRYYRWWSRGLLPIAIALSPAAAVWVWRLWW
jgi:hypothetical protein